MADALISPAVGGAMLAVAAGLAVYSIHKIQNDMDEKKIPLMGVTGAFVFAAQMINFSIPATGSSGHIVGALLLAALLGPYAAFLSIASVLLIQALFFADGGLLAYGANVFNMGFFACFLAYPLIYRGFTGKGYSAKKIFLASLISVVVALQLSAFCVVLETLLSGKTELPFATFLLFMQPVHLAIGVVEGLVTAAILIFVWKSRPEILERAASGQALGALPLKKILAGFAAAIIVTGGALSWFASAHPDGLEWSVFKTTGATELETGESLHETLSSIQERTAFLPDYNFRAPAQEAATEAEDEAVWPSINSGTSVSGIIGSAVMLVFAVLLGGFIHLVKRRNQRLST
jgi:cobalt/nickel transport system permease protein